MLYWLAYAGAQGFGGLIGRSFLLSHEPGQDLAVLGGKSVKFIVSTMELAAGAASRVFLEGWGRNFREELRFSGNLESWNAMERNDWRIFFLRAHAPLILAPSNKIHDIHMYEFISMLFFNTSYYYTIYTNIFYIPSYDAHFYIFCRDASVDIPRFDRLVESWKMTQQDSGNWRMRWRKLKYDQITQISSKCSKFYSQ